MTQFLRLLSQCATARLCLGARGTSSKSVLTVLAQGPRARETFHLFVKMLHGSWNVRRMFFVLCCCTCWSSGARRMTNDGDEEFVRIVEDDAMNVSVLNEVHSSLLPTRVDTMMVARNIRFRTCSIQRFTFFEDAMVRCDPADHIS